MKAKHILPVLFRIAIFYIWLNPLSGQDVWTSLPTMPTASGFLGGVAYEGKIYLFGGASPDHTTATNKAWVFDPSDGSYSALPDMPEPRSSAGTVEVDGKIYVMGGGNSVVGNIAYNTNYIFDPLTETWDTAPPMPHTRFLFAITAVGKKIYVIGGAINNAELTNLVDVYDTETQTWAAGIAMPSPKAFLTAASVDGKIYIFGGTVNAYGIGMSSVDIFIPATGIWTTGAQMPTKRFAATSVALNGEIYVLGGSSLDAVDPFFSTVEKYNPVYNTWQTLPSMLTGARGRTAATVDGNIYAFGGIYTASPSGLLASDSAEVLQISNTNLSEPKCRMGSAALGNKAYFAGGTAFPTAHLSKVEIYDVTSDTWTYANLSQPRAYPAGTSAGSKVLFAGGANFVTGLLYGTVDIFDTLTNEWTIAQLSVPRVNCKAESADGIAVFAGGATLNPFIANNTVDIYDAAYNTWSATQLSEARMDMGTAVAETSTGKIAFFAGGTPNNGLVSDRIDLYHFATNTWTTATLPQARTMIICAAVGSKVLFAGGMTAANQPTDRVDIYDAETGAWTTAQLSEARCSNAEGATACGKAYFAGGGVIDITGPQWLYASDRIDIYDAVSGTWSTDTLENPIVNQSVLAINDRVLIAGGLNNLGQYVETVENIQCQTSAVGDVQKSLEPVLVFPNPAGNRVVFQFENPVSGQLTLTAPNGAMVYAVQIKDQISWEVSVAPYPDGLYFWKFTDAAYAVRSGKIMIIK